MILEICVLSFLLTYAILYLTRFYLTRGKLSRGDTFFHLLLSESIRKNKWKYPSSLTGVTLSEIDKNNDYLAYPPLFHYLVSLFPMKYYETIAKHFNLVVLSLMSSIATFFVYGVTNSVFYALFAVSVLISNFSILSLVIQFSPRCLGLFLYTMIVCVSIFFPLNLFSLLLIAFLVTCLGLTHKFAMQVLVFSFIPYILLFNQPYIILSFALGFLLLIIVGRGFYIKILKEHIRWLNFYRLRPFRAPLKSYLTAILGGNVWILFIILSIFVGLFQNIFFQSPNILLTNLYLKVVFFSLINILIAVAVSIPALSFLGEYSRYVEYSAAPIAISCSLLTAILNPYFIIASLVFIFLSLLALSKYKKYLVDSRAIIDSDDVSSYHSLKELNLSNVIVFPARTLEVNYYSRISVVHPVRGAETPLEQVTHLTENYRLKFVLKFKDSDPYGLFATLTKMKKMEKVLDFKNFEVYQINDANSINY